MSLQAIPRQTPLAPALAVEFRHPMANAWGTSLLRHLAAGLQREPLGDPQGLMRRIGRTAQAEFRACFHHRHAPPDASACIVLGVSALMLSAYRELGQALGSPGRAYAIVERALVLAYQSFVRNICLPLLQGLNPEEADVTRMNFQGWGQEAWCAVRGSGQTAYQRFFARHGEPRLAHILQAADQSWIQVLAGYTRSKQIQRQRFEGTESAFSPFHFVPLRSRPAQRRADAVLELATHSAPVWDEAG